ncbi:MAG TPA: FtsX-like permease family protein [Gammaproteobacteria bacterium]|nr:FtsX-like permease family protein [Gammaproteobacteria bacterium]
MDIRPILSALLRNKTGAVLIALQIALTLAIICNAVFIIHDRIVKMDRPTGYDADNMIVVDMTGYAADYNPEAAIRNHLDMLRGIPGVVDAAPSQAIPLSGGGWSDGLFDNPALKQPDVSTGVFHTDEHGLNTYGVRLAEGRNFTHEDVQYQNSDTYTNPGIAIVTRALAEKMFPGKDPLGKVFYDGNPKPVTIIGVVDTMEGYWPSWEGFERQIIYPTVFNRPNNRFLVRTLPGQRDAVMKVVEQKLGDSHQGDFVRHVRPLDYYITHVYEADHALLVLLAVMCGLILAITALGIVGLASFSVSQRTKQIGTRRALGARRVDIVRYFMTENWLITSIGVTLGSVLAVALNYWLVSLFQVSPISWYYIPVGVLCLWSLGLLAVLGPALRAAAIPPAIATRSV